MRNLIAQYLPADQRLVFRGMGPGGGFEYCTADTSTLEGLKRAERLHAAGWKAIQTGLFRITFERRKVQS